jgi:hypothetical protein
MEVTSELRTQGSGRGSDNGAGDGGWQLHGGNIGTEKVWNPAGDLTTEERVVDDSCM